MKRSELEFELPSERIAQRAIEPRDASRLMVLHRDTGRIEHRVFRDIAEYLRLGDLLVVNDTKVIPARFHCRRTTGGAVEGLFLHETKAAWRVLLGPSARLKLGDVLHVEVNAECGTRRAESARPNYALRLIERHAHGEWDVVASPEVEVSEFLQTVGETPLPPYIQRAAGPTTDDAERYQTVYAHARGAVAAPTAGLHFTPALLARLESEGVQRAEVTLHVGPGTFRPVDAEDLGEHAMHAEWFNVSSTTSIALRAARARVGRIVAVGTTAARVLESLDDEFSPRSDWTQIFIYPPYRFRHVDALLTNFHLPGSTLIALVMAFASLELIRAAYAEAIRERYRFYSFGDAMLIM